MSTNEAPAVTDSGTDHTADIAAIEQLIKDVETGYNTNDAELMVSGFLANASAGNAVGTVLTGREALTELLDKVVRRAVVEARSGAPGGMVAMYVAVETRHLLAGHGGDIKGCRPCTDEAVLLVASTGNAGW